LALVWGLSWFEKVMIPEPASTSFNFVELGMAFTLSPRRHGDKNTEIILDNWDIIQIDFEDTAK
jgi:hypothetical protein